jgi:hypothetical protein
VPAAKGVTTIYDTTIEYTLLQPSAAWYIVQPKKFCEFLLLFASCSDIYYLLRRNYAYGIGDGTARGGYTYLGAFQELVKFNLIFSSITTLFHLSCSNLGS